MERIKFLQIIKAILGRNLLVLNFSYHLPKPWTDRFAHVNGKEPFIFYSYPSNKVEKQKNLSEDRLFSFTSSHMKEKKLTLARNRRPQEASGKMNKLSQSAMIAHLIHFCISPCWVENARGGKYFLNFLSYGTFSNCFIFILRWSLLLRVIW